MGANGKGGWDGPAVWPPPPTEEVMTTPRLSKDGMHVEGWVRRPATAWKPSDLLWLPPSATKSTDIDGIGQIVDVKDFGGIGDYDWVMAQLNKRQKYLDFIREKVRIGAYRMTAQLAKMLGLPFDEDSAELMPRTGSVAYGKMAAAKSLKEEADRLISGPTADNRHKYGLCACHGESGLPIIPGRSS